MEQITAQHVVFIVISLIIVGTAMVVVTARNLFHAALALMAAFAGVAGMYALLEAGFLAAAQLLVYIGAISVLLIFAIMMTRRLMQTTESPFNSQALASLVAAVFTFAILALAIVRFWGGPELSTALSDAPVAPPGAIENTVTALGVLFASPDAYVLSFELISLLLLGALVGSIFIARTEDE